MGRKKRFDKKSSVTFKLVHRSQRDPLAADESAPQMVFVDMNSSSDDNQRRDEQKKYGIYFDDDYNYLQHLRDVKHLTEWQPIDTNRENRSEERTQNSNALQFPSSLFASAVEEEEGLLNKGVLPIGPQPDWDPEVVAAMDEDFDFEDPNNQIDDDFVEQAENEESEECNDRNETNDDNEWEDMTDSEESEDDVSTVCGSDRSTEEANHLFSDEETKSHFTNYSMSSSVIRRNKNLTLLDQRFETLYESEYANDCDIGALDLEDIEGSIDPNNSELMASLVEEYQNAKQKIFYENESSKEFYDYYKRREEESKESEDLAEIEIYDNSKKGDNDRWDCESILSTYSNVYNRPKLIRETNNKYPQRIQINEKTGLPIGAHERPGLTARKLAKLNAINGLGNDLTNSDSKSVRSSASRLTQLSIRQTNETPEQRRERKSALKEYRRERRTEKKANKEAFSAENIRLNKETINLRKSLNAIKLI